MTSKPIAREVQRAVEETNVSARRLSEDDARVVIQGIEDLYTGGKERWPLWEHIRFPARAQDADAWRIIGDFVGSAPCLLFFNPVDTTDAFEFASGEAARVNARYAVFDGADLTGADLSNANLEKATFRGAKLENVTWDGAKLEGAAFDAGADPRS